MKIKNYDTILGIPVSGAPDWDFEDLKKKLIIKSSDLYHFIDNKKIKRKEKPDLKDWTNKI